MRGRLIIEGRVIDITDEFSNQISYAVDDIRNLDSKATPFTKTMIIPGTWRNNDAFGHIFQFTSSNLNLGAGAVVAAGSNIGYDFNASKAADCYYEVDGMLVIKGVFRLLEIITDGEFIEYEGQIVGELGGLVAKLANKRLQDLDFSQYNHLYSASDIVKSWQRNYVYYVAVTTTFTAATKKIKVFGQLLSNLQVGSSITISGTSSNNGTFTIAAVTLNTVVYDKFTEIETVEALLNETVSSMLVNYEMPLGIGYFYPLIDYGNVSTDKINFQYTAFRPALFVREYVDKIITGAGYTWESNFFDTDFFKRLVIPNNDKGLFKAGATSYIDANNTSAQNVNITAGLTRNDVVFQNSTLNNFSVNGGNTLFTYTAPSPIQTKARLLISGTYTRPAGGQLRLFIIATNGSSEYEFPVGSGDFDINLELATNFVTGDTIKVEVVGLQGLDDVAMNITSAELVLEKDPPGRIELAIGEAMIMNDTIPKGIFQRDFLTSIIKMFNLMIKEDKLKDRHLIIEPYPDFYQTQREDWTDKLDRSKPIRQKPMSELNARYYQFKYKQDNDYYNEAYRKKYSEGYGDRIFDTAYDFAKDTESVEVIFSSSVLFGAGGTDKVYPAIYKKSGNDGFEDTIEHNIRILQVKRIEGVSSWDILNGSTVLDSLTEYGYGGHLDDPDAPAADINFGVPKELQFALVSGDLSANLFNAYYSGYMAEITDKDSRLLTADFWLTTLDIYNLDFSKYKFIDGALFRLQKVIDWNDKGEDVTKCELLRVINTSYD